MSPVQNEKTNMRKNKGQNSVSQHSCTSSYIFIMSSLFIEVWDDLVNFKEIFRKLIGCIQGCAGRCLTIAFWGLRDALICSVQQFLWCKCPCHGSFQASNMKSLSTDLGSEAMCSGSQCELVVVYHRVYVIIFAINLLDPNWKCFLCYTPTRIMKWRIIVKMLNR